MLLLDIEGTTTPVAFVYSVLFPYARSRMGEYLTRSGDPDVEALRAEAGSTPLEEYVLGLMDADRKVGALKAIQGRIWEEGYRSGQLRGQVFADVPGALAAWRAAGTSVNIYSSGSVLAQRLLFGHSEAGDLTPFLDHYFDTGVGPKQDPESYRRIATTLGGTGLFATDVLGEAQAACAAGWRVVLMDRPGNAPQPAHEFPVLSDFTQLNQASPSSQP